MENSSSQLKKDYFWNTMGSGMNAAFSVFLMMAVTRIAGAYVGGVFSFAYAVAQQLQPVGAYEMRGYQATDIRHFFKFGTYFASRIVTCGIMMICAAAYGFYHEGITEEAIVLILICALKALDAFEDVFHGMFQQYNKLYLAGRALFFRLLITVVTFIAVLFVTGSLLFTSAVTFLVSAGFLFWLNIPEARKLEELRPSFQWNKIKGLLATCFPLFLGSFILLYLYNIPKYSMENYLSKEFQSYYAILFMPASVINLFSGFAFKPLQTTLAVNWEEGKKSVFVRILLKGVGIVAVLTVAAVAVGYPLGTPVLSWLYGVDLSAYRMELVLLLVGGGFSAASVILYYGLMVMRHQRLILAGYTAALLLALPVADPLIKGLGIQGASWLYLGLMLLVTLLFAVMIAVFLKKKQKKQEEK